MSRKRRMFDIDMPATEDIPVGTVPDRILKKDRRGPMASAISENADSLRNRTEMERDIRSENDRLAHEFVAAKNAGLVVARIPLESVVTEKLIRDRGYGEDPELDELKTSIQEIGLSNPIRVEASDNGTYELLQGMRRLTAYKALYAETGEQRYIEIPAIIAKGAVELKDSYRQMVDENLVRKDISFAEMGVLAQAYAEDSRNECPDVDKAVAVLFKSASYTKRSYIRAFATLMLRMGAFLEHPTELPRNVGVSLKRRLDADPGVLRALKSALQAEPDRDAETEVAILRSFASGEGGFETLPAGKVAAPSKKAQGTRKPKATFTLVRDDAHAKCLASAGRVEVHYDMDFSALDRPTLERALGAFLDALGDDAAKCSRSNPAVQGEDL